MPFQNLLSKIAPADDDRNQNIEQGIKIPWASNPSGSYVYYDCAVGVMLDSGIVVHNRLPQVNSAPNTLASTFLDAADLETITNKGVNLLGQDQYTDIVQRMAHSRYWFRIWGQALRVGYRIPIPGIHTIGGRTAIPHDDNPQWAYNTIAPGGNYSGVILWHAVWSLWYTIAEPPFNNNIAIADPSAHITGDVAPPEGGIQAPFSQSNDNPQLQRTQPAGQGGAKPPQR